VDTTPSDGWLTECFRRMKVWMNQTNQRNQMNQIDQINQPLSLRKNKQSWEDGMGSLV